MNYNMIVVKLIEVAIDVADFIGIFVDEQNILELLKHKYEKRCYAKCYILQINKIVRRGECIINQDGAPSFGQISVMFEADVIEYAAGEVITGCVVKKHDPRARTLICSTNHAYVMLASSDELQSIAEGQIIPIQVGVCRYPIGGDKIVINAIPYVPSRMAFAYHVDMANIPAPALNEVKKILTGRIGSLVRQEEQLAEETRKARPDRWDVFEKLVYPYVEQQKPPAGARVLSIKDIINDIVDAGSGGGSTLKSVKYICRDPRAKLTTPDVYVFDKQPPADYTVMDVPLSAVLAGILQNYADHLRIVRELIEVYHTDELIAKHRNLWAIYARIKQSK